MSGSEPTTFPRPPRFLADENLENAVVYGARRKRPGIVFLTAAEAGTRRLKDPDLLERARELDLILITYDRRTMPQYFAESIMRLPEGEQRPGIFIIKQQRYSIGQIIEFILEVYDASSHDEWRNLDETLPL